MKKLTVLSYNIHKGFNATKLNKTLNGIKESLDEVHADVLCLQEIFGHHTIHGGQLEKLADKVWHNYAYGKNAVYSKGHHGNAILSKYPIKQWENFNISSLWIENRSFLHAELDIPHRKEPLHMVCTHLALLQTWRKKQLELIAQHFQELDLKAAPLMICGDFNDWTGYATKYLQKELGLKEAYHQLHREHAKTYPSWLPLLALDRIYFSHLKLNNVRILSGKIWDKLSDHRPILAEFYL